MAKKKTASSKLSNKVHVPVWVVVVVGVLVAGLGAFAIVQSFAQGGVSFTPGELIGDTGVRRKTYPEGAWESGKFVCYEQGKAFGKYTVDERDKIQAYGWTCQTSYDHEQRKGYVEGLLRQWSQ